MGGIFSHHHKHHKKPPKVQVTDHDRAVLDLKASKDRLKRYQVKVSQYMYAYRGWCFGRGWRDRVCDGGWRRKGG